MELAALFPACRSQHSSGPMANHKGPWAAEAQLQALSREQHFELHEKQTTYVPDGHLGHKRRAVSIPGIADTQFTAFISLGFVICLWRVK